MIKKNESMDDFAMFGVIVIVSMAAIVIFYLIMTDIKESIYAISGLQECVVKIDSHETKIWKKECN